MSEYHVSAAIGLVALAFARQYSLILIHEQNHMIEPIALYRVFARLNLQAKFAGQSTPKSAVVFWAVFATWRFTPKCRHVESTVRCRHFNLGLVAGVVSVVLSKDCSNLQFRSKWSRCEKTLMRGKEITWCQNILTCSRSLCLWPKMIGCMLKKLILERR